MRARWAVLFVLCWAAPATAQVDTLWVDPQVSPAVVKLGQPVTVSFQFPREAGDTLQGPEAPMSMGSLDLLSSAEISTTDSLGWRVTVSLFELGEVNLPPLPFLLRRHGQPRWVVTRPYRVTVNAIAPDTAQALRAAKPPVPTPLRWEWFMVIGAMLALALLIWWIWFWRRHRLDSEPWVDHTPPVPPHQEAYRALQRLKEDSLPARGMMQEHYYRLSGILRLYMERRFHFPAVEGTTYEIAPQLERLNQLEPDLRSRAVDLLDRADLAKFAKANPGAEAAQEDLDHVREWVARTTAPGTTEESA